MNLDFQNFLKVFSHKGAKNPSYLTSDCKSQVTVLVCTSAAGYALPPSVIFDQKTINSELTNGEVPGSRYELLSKGWIDMELFNGFFVTFCYMSHHQDPFCF